ncbi:RapZ C-terminal domain-containing protein [Kitasatospora aureofaciens]|uniref:RapZ C-terminal domain-containing protein n=1 Tax=Kitasatospora aureofaciens TaxID=1894 RepID=UPI00340DFD03
MLNADQPAAPHFEITTYGTLHQDPPTGDALTVDLTTVLRNPPEDPTVRDWMIRSNGLDRRVLAYVLATPGARDITWRTARRAVTQLTALPGETVRIHVYCRGGRHRSVAVGREVARILESIGARVALTHRHVHRDVVEPPLADTKAATAALALTHKGVEESQPSGH